MRYILSLGLVLTFLIWLMSLSTPVGATMTVSWETRITSPIKPKPVLKSKLTKAQIKILLDTKKQILTDIDKLKVDITKYSANVSGLKVKIDARKKAGITDNADLEAKMKALKKALLQVKKDLAILMEKLVYIDSKLKY